MLIEQIIEVESRVPGLLVVRIPKTGYFHNKIKIFKAKFSSEWFKAKNVAESKVPWLPWPGQVTKFNPKMQDFKRVLDLTWSKGRDLFNWLWNLKNFILSNRSENMRNVIQMTYKPFFSKNLQEIVQRLGAASPDSHSLRWLLAPPPGPVCDTFELH